MELVQWIYLNSDKRIQTAFVGGTTTRLQHLVRIGDCVNVEGLPYPVVFAINESMLPMFSNVVPAEKRFVFAFTHENGDVLFSNATANPFLATTLFGELMATLSHAAVAFGFDFVACKPTDRQGAISLEVLTTQLVSGLEFARAVVLLCSTAQILACARGFSLEETWTDMWM